MNYFDTSIINFLNSLSQKLPLLNTFMLFIVDNDFIKGGVVVSIFWFFWFQEDENIIYKRERIVISLISCIAAITVGRLLAKVLPFRSRPLINPDLSLLFPNKSVIHGLDMNSSLPSDHAVMFFALATGIFLVSRKIGVLTYLYVLFFICFPRIYLGLHYPTDILAGAIIGIIITLILSLDRISRPISQKILQFSLKYSGIFYVLFFWLTFQIGTMFDSGRYIGNFLFRIIRYFT